jgi:uncharacterized protein (TIGR02449 family)
LTRREISHKLPAVTVADPLAPLERQIDDLLTHLHELRRDNRALRAQVQQLQVERDQLAGRIETASTRLQRLHDSLPEDAS